jgi:hypothetical protein
VYQFVFGTYQIAFAVLHFGFAVLQFSIKLPKNVPTVRIFDFVVKKSNETARNSVKNTVFSVKNGRFPAKMRRISRKIQVRHGQKIREGFDHSPRSRSLSHVSLFTEEISTES